MLELLRADVELTAGNWAAAEQALRGVSRGDASRGAYGCSDALASQGTVDDGRAAVRGAARRSPTQRGERAEA